MRPFLDFLAQKAQQSKQETASLQRLQTGPSESKTQELQ